MDHVSERPEGQSVRDRVAHERAAVRFFERMEMAPGTVWPDKLHIRELLGRLVAYDPALPGHGEAEPSDGIVELGVLVHLGLRVFVLHHESEPVRCDIEEVPRVLEEDERFFPG